MMYLAILILSAMGPEMDNNSYIYTDFSYSKETSLVITQINISPHLPQPSMIGTSNLNGPWLMRTCLLKLWNEYLQWSLNPLFEVMKQMNSSKQHDQIYDLTNLDQLQQIPLTLSPSYLDDRGLKFHVCSLFFFPHNQLIGVCMLTLHSKTFPFLPDVKYSTFLWGFGEIISHNGLITVTWLASYGSWPSPSKTNLQENGTPTLIVN